MAKRVREFPGCDEIFLQSLCRLISFVAVVSDLTTAGRFFEMKLSLFPPFFLGFLSFPRPFCFAFGWLF